MMDLEKKNLISLRDATQFCPYSQEYLSLRARNGKLKSIKIGRVWMTNREWLYEYINRVEKYKEDLNKKHFSFRKSGGLEGLKQENIEPVSESESGEEKIVKIKKALPPLNLPVESNLAGNEELVFNEFPSYCQKSRKPFLKFGAIFLIVLFFTFGIFAMPFLKKQANSFPAFGMGAAHSTIFAIDNILDMGADCLMAVGKDSNMMIAQIKEISPLLDSALYGLEYTNDVFFQYLSWLKETAKKGIGMAFKKGSSMESNLLFISLDILENIRMDK